MLEHSQRFSTGGLLPITFYIVTNLYTLTHHSPLTSVQTRYIASVPLTTRHSPLNSLATSIDRVATPNLPADADTNFYFGNAIPWL